MSTRAVHIELIELISSAVMKTRNDQHFCKLEVKIITERTFRLFFYLIVGQNYLFFFQKGWSSVSCARRWNKLSNFALLVQQPFPSKHCKGCGQFPDLQTCNQTCNNTSLRWKIFSFVFTQSCWDSFSNFVNYNFVHSKIEKWRFFELLIVFP